MTTRGPAMVGGEGMMFFGSKKNEREKKLMGALIPKTMFDDCEVGLK